MAAWIERIRAMLIEPEPLELADRDMWKLEIARPLLDRLGPRWIREDEATRDLWSPSTRIFWADQLGLIERRRSFFRREWWIRLSGRAWDAEFAEAEPRHESRPVYWGRDLRANPLPAKRKS
jgi:hypothetical protein